MIIFADPKYTVVDRGLEITNPTLENAGEYQCRALQMQTGDFNFHKIILRLKRKYVGNFDIANGISLIILSFVLRRKI